VCNLIICDLFFGLRLCVISLYVMFSLDFVCVELNLWECDDLGDNFSTMTHCPIDRFFPLMTHFIK
jgi:hypothetical protein